MNQRILASTVVALILSGMPTPSAAASNVLGVTGTVPSAGSILAVMPAEVQTLPLRTKIRLGTTVTRG